MSTIKNVVVLGSTGNVGAPIVSALSFSNFNVTAVSRSLPTTASPFPSTVSHKTTDYTSTSLTTLFQNQDALILAFNPSALSLHHRTITNTAIASGIKHVITPDFCTDTFTENVEELKIFEPKLDAQRYLEDKIKGTETKWTAIVTGPFWDWAIPRGIFWLDPKTNTVIIFGSGTQRVSMSSISIVGRATVAVLSDTSSFINRPAYFADFTLSTQELLQAAEEITGEKWNKNGVPLTTFFEEGKKAWDIDTENGVEDRLNSTAYQMLGTYGVFEEGNRYGADFEERVEKGWGKGLEELKKELKAVIQVTKGST